MSVTRSPLQVVAVMSAHLVIMVTPARWAGSVSPVSATTTLTHWTQNPAMPEPASVSGAFTTVRAPPARAASWVTMAMPCYRTAGVSTQCSIQANRNQ